ncbi:hypothetical protein M3589_16195 [Heyndrickxia oleronia]|uniref:hypothetical protein n=1 Tax=Heyndrickxia oleronia TaxID=38875 RepID=UPI002042317D|nr:hypothetical protein [Heyndrickxia oleronia]MCM3239244.1 hypothetical protein [Heyndrickxia oleronia]
MKVLASDFTQKPGLDSFARFGYPGSAFQSFSGFFRSLWLPWISGLILFGVLSLALVTLDQRFNPFRGSFARFGYPGSALSSFSGFFRSLWLPSISVLILFRVLSLALVTLKQDFHTFEYLSLALVTLKQDFHTFEYLSLALVTLNRR